MTNVLTIEIADSPDEAPNYNRDCPDIRGAVIKKVVIVNRGTVSGKPTVDFLFLDQEGAEYVAMLAGELVKQLANAVVGVEARP